jgi:hypothetical protein
LGDLADEGSLAHLAGANDDNGLTFAKSLPDVFRLCPWYHAFFEQKYEFARFKSVKLIFFTDLNTGFNQMFLNCRPRVSLFSGRGRRVLIWPERAETPGLGAAPKTIFTKYIENQFFTIYPVTFVPANCHFNFFNFLQCIMEQ